jgi:hypothetical protein
VAVATAVPFAFFVLAAWWGATYARGLIGGFGADVGPLLGVAAANLAAMIAVLPAYAVVDLPRATWNHLLPERRWRAGRCPDCGHPAVDRARPCPECGAAFARPPAYAADWRTLRRMALLVLPAWALGTALGMAAFLADERAFEREVAVHRASVGDGPCGRPRAGATFARLEWSPPDGFTATTPFESAKDPLPRRR